MDGGNMERDATALAIREVQKLELSRWLIQKAPERRGRESLYPNARVLLQFIKLLQPILGEQLVHKKATLTTEHFFLLGKLRVWTGLPTMEARESLQGSSSIHTESARLIHLRREWRWSSPTV